MSTLLKTKKKNCWICHQPSSTRISLHRIPEKEFVVKDAWLQILRVEERNIPRFLICSRHFVAEDFVGQGNRKKTLKPYAVPSRKLNLVDDEQNVCVNLIEYSVNKFEDSEQKYDVQQEQEFYVATDNDKDFELDSLLILQPSNSIRNVLKEHSYMKIPVEPKKQFLRKCHVPNCQTERNREDGTILHKIPADKDLALAWSDILNLKKPVSTNSLICSKHFQPTDYINQSRHGQPHRRLKKEAIPFATGLPELIDILPFDTMVDTYVQSSSDMACSWPSSSEMVYGSPKAEENADSLLSVSEEILASPEDMPLEMKESLSDMACSLPSSSEMVYGSPKAEENADSFLTVSEEILASTEDMPLEMEEVIVDTEAIQMWPTVCQSRDVFTIQHGVDGIEVVPKVTFELTSLELPYRDYQC